MTPKPENQNESVVASPIEAPYLQLVMTRLWEKERSKKSTILQLETLKDDLKDLDNIVQIHLNEKMDKLGADQREISAAIFGYLVTPSGTKIAYTKGDLAKSDGVKPILAKSAAIEPTLAEGADVEPTLAESPGVEPALAEGPDVEPAKSAGVKPTLLDLILGTLVDDSRILRVIEPLANRPGSESRYEVFHDVLAKAILKWRDDYNLQKVERKRRRRVLLYSFVGAFVMLLLSLGFALFTVNQAEKERLKLEQEKVNVETLAQIEQARLTEKYNQEAIEKATYNNKKLEEKINETLKAESFAKKEKDRADMSAKKADKSAKELAQALNNQKVLTGEQKDFYEKCMAERRQLESTLLEKITLIQSMNAFGLKEILQDVLKRNSDSNGVGLNPNSRASLSNFIELLEKDSTNSGNDLQPLGQDPTLTKKWPDGRVLHVSFLGCGTMRENTCSAVEAGIEKAAKEWTQYANLEFVFDSSREAEIRIGFTAGEGSWSYIGTDTLVISKDQQTMEFGILMAIDPATEDFKRIVLHEFGHVLGLIHGLQVSGASVIPWDKPKVYDFYASTMGWSKEEVDNNLLRTYSNSFAPFDRYSIMTYQVPRVLFRGDYVIPGGIGLTGGDKKVACKLYPSNPVKPACSALNLEQ